jgi:hypothetical protein
VGGRRVRRGLAPNPLWRAEPAPPQLSGSANTGYRPVASGAWTAAPFARVGLAFAVNATLRVRADVLATGIFQGVSIELAQQEVATFGAPIVVASAGIDFGWL